MSQARLTSRTSVKGLPRFIIQEKVDRLNLDLIKIFYVFFDICDQ